MDVTHKIALYCMLIHRGNTVAYLGFHFGGGGGFKIFLEKWGYLHGEATRLLGGFWGMLPRENFKNLCNLVRFRE